MIQQSIASLSLTLANKVRSNLQYLEILQWGQVHPAVCESPGVVFQTDGTQDNTKQSDTGLYKTKRNDTIQYKAMTLLSMPYMIQVCCLLMILIHQHSKLGETIETGTKVTLLIQQLAEKDNHMRKTVLRPLTMLPGTIKLAMALSVPEGFWVQKD